MKKLENVKLMELNEAYIKIMQWFFAYPITPISLSELAKETGVSKKTATKIVSQFLLEGFLIKEEIGKAWRISCNQVHPYNHTRKIGYNLITIYQIIYENGLINEIYKIAGNPKAIVLFGSYRKGDDINKSDIDLAVEVTGNENMRIVNLGNIPLLGYRKNVSINLHIFSRKNVDANLFSNIANGILIEGFLEVKP